MFVYYELREKN